MEKVIIKPEAAYYAYYNEETGSWIEKDLIESNLPISWYTQMLVEIEGKISIRRIFELFERYEDQLNFMYAKDLKTLTITDIAKILAQEKKTDSNIPILSICLIWVGEYLEETDGGYITISSALVGLDSSEETLDEESQIDERVFQLSNFDFAQWSTVPIYLDDYLDFINESDPEMVFSGIYEWKLGDLFSCLFAEISLNLFVSGLVSHPEISIDIRNPTMGVLELFDYLDELDGFANNL